MIRYQTRPINVTQSLGGFADSPPYDLLDSLSRFQSTLNTQSAQEANRFNRIDEYTPFGTRKFGYGRDGTLRSFVDLTPQQESLLAGEQKRDARTGRIMDDVLRQQGNALATPFSLDGLPEAPGAEGANQARERIEDAVYDRYRRRLDDRFSQEQQSFEQRMAEQGIPVGSELYTRMMRDNARNRGDAFTDAQTQAMVEGRAEADQYYRLQGGARDRALSERLSERQMPLQEMAALRQQYGGYRPPVFSGLTPISVQGVDALRTGEALTSMANASREADINRGFNAQQSALDRELEMAIAKMSGADRLALQKLSNAGSLGVAGLNNQASLDRIEFQDQIAQANRPGKGSMWADVGWGVASGVGAGLGQGLGGLFGQSQDKG